MAAPYFIWKSVDSRTFGIWVSQYPDIVRPQERVNHLTIAGRAGQLTTTEGEDIYEPITLQMRIQLTSSRSNWQNIIDWLSGDSLLVLGRRPNRAYTARLVSEVAFTKYSNDIAEATLEFEAEPFTQSYPTEDPVVVDVSESPYTFYNNTDTIAYPIISLYGTGEVTVTVNDNTLTIADISNDAILDCGALMATDALGANILDSTTGDFFNLRKGLNTVSWTGDVTGITIQPKWRWLG